MWMISFADGIFFVHILKGTSNGDEKAHEIVNVHWY
jgi:hypothetical protein